MSVSLWALVIVFVILGLSLLFLILSSMFEPRSRKLTLGVMGAGLFGVVLGWGAFSAGVWLTGQQLEFSVAGFEGEVIELPGDGASADRPAADIPGGGAGMPGVGGMGMPGVGGGGMPGGGGRRGPSSRRSLVTLVQKLDVLTDNIRVEFSTKQAKDIGALLVKAGGSEKMTDEQAKEALEAVQSALNDEQKAVLERISLPRRRRSGGGFGGGGSQGAADENPFTEADNHKSLLSLLKRHGIKPPEISVKKGDESPGGEQPAGGDRQGGTSDASIIETLLKQHDKDGDGALSIDEAPRFFKDRFDRIDTNKDGKCDLKEMTAARQVTRGG